MTLLNPASCTLAAHFSISLLVCVEHLIASSFCAAVVFVRCIVFPKHVQMGMCITYSNDEQRPVINLKLSKNTTC